MANLINSNKKLAFYEGFAEQAFVAATKLISVLEDMQAAEQEANLSAATRVYNRLAEISTGEKGSGGYLDIVGAGCRTAIEGCDAIIGSKALSNEFKSRAKKAKENLEDAVARCKVEFNPVQARKDGDEHWTEGVRAKYLGALHAQHKIKLDMMNELGDLFAKTKEEDTFEIWKPWMLDFEAMVSMTSQAIRELRDDLIALGVDVSDLFGQMDAAIATFKTSTATVETGKSVLDEDMSI